MSKVLYIKATVKPEGQSRTVKVSDQFIEEYKLRNPEDEIMTLDLYNENIDFLKGEDLGAVFGPKDETSKTHPVLKYAYQFVEADKYVISAPMWNLSVPAIVKAYIDYVSVSGITFKYTENGPVGMCGGKKAVYVVTRGGSYSEGPAAMFEMGERYLRTIFGFFGITDFTTIALDNLDVVGEDVDAIMERGLKQVEEVVKGF